ncbi:TetR/AcrR family transcriptional regulator [Dysgonomonas sp. 216]|uniref:TetR/AcrR family transcriptional regulator n=1 Tax=Dysgonomonas sp. 216 TaxID=2302934 RepID=UPI0013D39566|nr:TetR/AcrR family transcriptional regulator [Dysgonomonas sp. 216]NDW18174.1 TetR/AcrR family transcriptional regulator [Dysgonomonas sp. 216]
MKYSREYILRRAFDVFMDKGYDSTSISVLQIELNMSRGAMYRYFKNKEDLFTSVIDQYFFKVFNRFAQSLDEGTAVSDYIEILRRKQKPFIMALTKSGITQTSFLNYTALAIQAAKHYPDFLKRLQELDRRILNNWRNALRESIAIGEIKEDVNIDVMSRIFSRVSTNESVENDLDYALDATAFAEKVLLNVKMKDEIMNYLFNLIKK